MSDMYLHEELEIIVDKSVIARALVNDASFLSNLRNAELLATRRLGNRMGRWAQKQPKPVCVQPNARQRIW